MLILLHNNCFGPCEEPEQQARVVSVASDDMIETSQGLTAHLLARDGQ
jgi:hypothetical protein